MIIRLGYVAISLTLDLTTSKTITYTYYSKLKKNDKIIKIDSIINENLHNLKQIMLYNFKNNIHFYRLSPNIIPLATHPNTNRNIEKYKKQFEIIGYMSKLYNIRLDTHPDHFCVLNSNKKEVIKNSIKILKYHYDIFKTMNINGKAILHIGGAYDNKEKSIEIFIKNFKKLDKKIQNIIILENDDKIYNIKDTLYICETLKIPMVLDYHHYLCNNEKENIEDYIPRILNTWKNEKLNPKIHFSSPKNKKEFRSHSNYINSHDFIKFINILKKYNTNIDIMLECKAKDEAMFRLIRQLKYKTNYHFINETTFEINKEHPSNKDLQD